MNRRKVYVVAGAIVVSGAALALQFRRSDQPPADAAGWAAADRPATTAENLPQHSNPALQSEQPSVAVRPTFDGHIEGTVVDSQPAAVSNALAELDRQIFPLKDAIGSAPVETNKSERAQTELMRLDREEKLHRIADGDTLVRLAERYLGNANRQQELYDYNRDVLTSPDVLPIGAELRIPPLIPVQIAAPPAEMKPAEEAQGNAHAPLGPLTPLAADTTKPKDATLATTTTASSTTAKSPKPRTYQVQVGDNLVDISRKLYGDGRHHEQLFEANRSVLKNPGAIKAGMVLVVP